MSQPLRRREVSRPAIIRPNDLTRRAFLGAAGAAAACAAGGAGVPAWAVLADGAAAPVAPAAPAHSEPESLVKLLFESFSEEQRKQVCFDWDHKDPEKGLLRTRVENNWQVTAPDVNGEFYTKDQRAMIRSIYEGLFQPDWVKKVDQQLEDDAGGWGNSQGIAIFGTPGSEKFEFVMTGRHLTIRCDGNSAQHVAFAGPIFHGHAAQGFNEKPDHPGNIFWPQALEANKLYQMLDGKQREIALVASGMPSEEEVAFRGKEGAEKKLFQGIPVTELAADQKEQVQKVLKALIEPYRQSDQDEAVACLNTQGGLDACHLAFFGEADLGNDGVWDNWRLEGPSFVWHFRGKPHVHIWINVAADPSVELNA